MIARTTVAEYLRGCGYKDLNTEQEAVAAIENHRVDILVSDIERREQASGSGPTSWFRAGEL